MDTPGIINQAIHEVDLLTKTISSNKSIRVRIRDEQELIKANVFSWFKGHRIHFQILTGNEILNSIDENFRQLLEFSDKQVSRSRYKNTLKFIKAELIKLRSEVIRPGYFASGTKDKSSTSIPDFSRLIADEKMITILNRRWIETTNCIENKAPLSALIMMGALLESLLLARINTLSDKKHLFSLKSTPKDKTKKPLPLQEWGLNDFLEIAFEMKWIRKPAKEVGNIIRDYRNFIHPVKELGSGFQIEDSDAKMFWPIFRELSKQIIES